MSKRVVVEYVGPMLMGYKVKVNDKIITTNNYHKLLEAVLQAYCDDPSMTFERVLRNYILLADKEELKTIQNWLDEKR